MKPLKVNKSTFVFSAFVFAIGIFFCILLAVSQRGSGDICTMSGYSTVLNMLTDEVKYKTDNPLPPEMHKFTYTQYINNEEQLTVNQKAENAQSFYNILQSNSTLISCLGILSSKQETLSEYTAYFEDCNNSFSFTMEKAINTNVADTYKLYLKVNKKSHIIVGYASVKIASTLDKIEETFNVTI